MTAFYYFCGHEQWQPEILVEHAVAAEAAGFDGVLVSEHFHPWVDDRGASGFAFATLGAMARATRRVRLATGVTTPLFRFHPAVVAQAAATLDRLSGGRFDLGVGTGENINEGPLGLPFPAYTERARRLAEALEVMRRLLDGEKTTFTGRYYQTDRARLYSPPLSRVAIWMAAGGPQSAALAGERADGVIASVKDPAESLDKVIHPARAAAAAARRPPATVVATRWVVHAADETEAWQALLPWRGLRAPGRLEAVDPEDLRRRADDLPRAEVLGRYTVAADADALVAAYRPLVEQIGADVVTLQVASLRQEETIARLGAEVLPRLRRLTPAG
ncbi:MAG: TIGR03557 family F420-dependent LLM class oxidoreductase [Acidimicrobiia bacterium]|nr:TIGR03557 family F420-dependent LLM class oxidoreductase [Acidimicrobiia bacterium]